MLDDFFCLTLDGGSKFTVKFLEWKLLPLFCKNESIHTNIGKQFCLTLDVALESSGCDAIVERFYSLFFVVNNVLIQRAVIDWTLHHPIGRRKIMK